MEKKPWKFNNDQPRGTSYKDPAFVMLGFSRVSSTGQRLFGSQLIHHNYITMTISEAEYNRDSDLHSDWYTSGGKLPLLEVAMSAEQFAEAITTMNVGSGVPATLTYHNRERYEMPEMPTKAEQFKKEVNEKVKDKINEINDLTSKIKARFEDPKPLKVDEKKELLSSLERATLLFNSYLPFVMEQFEASMGKIVTESKAAVEAFVMDAVTKTGLETIQANKPTLIENKVEE
jgi:hypothetical protein